MNRRDWDTVWKIAVVIYLACCFMWINEKLERIDIRMQIYEKK